MEFRRLTDAEILAQLPATDEAERMAERTEPRAVRAWYDAPAGRIVVELTRGDALAFRPAQFPELAGLTPRELARVEIAPGGVALVWEENDAGIAVAGILVNLLGDAMLRAFASRGGSSTSEAKAAAARANGRKGGRPRKQPPARPYRADPHFGIMSAREQLIDPETGKPAAQGEETNAEIRVRRAREARDNAEEAGE